MYINKIRHAKKSNWFFSPILLVRCIKCSILNIFFLFVKFLCWNFSIPKKYTLISIKYFFEKKYSLKNILKIKRKYTHPFFLTTTSHTTKKLIHWKNWKNSTLLFWETTKLLPPIPPKKNLWVNPHPKKNSPLLIP